MKEAKSIIVLTVIAAVAAALLSLVNNVTASSREGSDSSFKLESLRAVLPEYDNPIDQEAVEVQYEDAGECKTAILYPARQGRTLVGVAVELSTPPGYGGTVRILVGVTSEGRVNEFMVLPGHQETPGLGTKVTEDAWREQFKGKCLDLGDQTWDVKKDEATGFVDQVTGATITSRAVTAGIHTALMLVNEHCGRFN